MAGAGGGVALGGSRHKSMRDGRDWLRSWQTKAHESKPCSGGSNHVATRAGEVKRRGHGTWDLGSLQCRRRRARQLAHPMRGARHLPPPLPHEQLLLRAEHDHTPAHAEARLTRGGGGETARQGDASLPWACRGSPRRNESRRRHDKTGLVVWSRAAAGHWLLAKRLKTCGRPTAVYRVRPRHRCPRPQRPQEAPCSWSSETGSARRRQ